MFSEVKTSLKLFYIIPGSSATAERSFSALRRISNYLRTTMTSQRLNSVVVLNVQRDLTDELDIPAVADEFVRGNSVRRHIWLTGCLNVTGVTQITAVDVQYNTIQYKFV